MYCPSCGKNITNESTFCMYCGKPTGLTPSVVMSASQRIIASPHVPVCPICGQMDKANRVSAIVSAGTSVGSTPTTQVGQLGGHTISGTVYRDTKLVSELAKKLSPPHDAELRTTVLSHMRPRPSPKDSTATVAWEAEYQMRFSGSRLWFYRLFYCERCDLAFVWGKDRFVALGRIGTGHTYEEVKQLDLILDTDPDYSRGYDVCELEAIPTEERLNMIQTLYYYSMVAQGVGQQGYYIAAQRKWKDVPHLGSFWGSAKTSQPAEKCSRCKQHYDQLVNELVSAGWERGSETGQLWWQTRFRRKMTSETKR